MLKILLIALCCLSSLSSKFTAAKPEPSSFFEVSVKDLDYKNFSFKQYEGKYVLLVASYSGAPDASKSSEWTWIELFDVFKKEFRIVSIHFRDQSTLKLLEKLHILFSNLSTNRCTHAVAKQDCTPVSRFVYYPDSRMGKRGETEKCRAQKMVQILLILLFSFNPNTN